MITAEQILTSKTQEMICVSCDTKISDAIKIMNENSIGAILVKDNDEVCGIWTERDLLHNINEENFSIHTSICNHMTKDLLSAPYNVGVYKLLDIFLGKKIRHILIEKENQYIGILSQGDVVKAALNLKIQEIEELNKTLDWEYYENWRFNWNK